jgi:hypothetical protein
MKTDLVLMVQFAGMLHFLQLPAILLAPRILRWKDDFKQLMPINRWIFNVTAGGIVLTGFGLGLIVFFFPNQIINSVVGQMLCLFLGVFWTYRSIVHFAIYSKVWPKDKFISRSSYWFMACVIPLKGILYWICFLSSAPISLP